MARVRTQTVEPPPRKPRAGWAEAAKAFREEQDSERLEKALGDSADEPRETSAYRCVDLDIRSRRSLAPLLAAWPQAQTPGRSSGRQAPRWLLLTGASNPRRAGTRASADQGLMQLVGL